MVTVPKCQICFAFPQQAVLLNVGGVTTISSIWETTGETVSYVLVSCCIHHLIRSLHYSPTDIYKPITFFPVCSARIHRR